MIIQMHITHIIIWLCIALSSATSYTNYDFALPLHRFIFKVKGPATGLATPIKIRLHDIYRLLNQARNPNTPQVINVDIINAQEANHKVDRPVTARAQFLQ